MELCTRYHTEVTDQILIGIIFLEQTNTTISQQVLGALKSLFNFTEHIEYNGIKNHFWR